MSYEQDLLALEENMPTLFDEWVHTPAGREVANKFIRLAVGLQKRGFAHFGAGAIVERIRWHMALKHGPNASDDYKINNNWRAGLARFAANRESKLCDFFRCREQKNKDLMPKTVLKKETPPAEAGEASQEPARQGNQIGACQS